MTDIIVIPFRPSLGNYDFSTDIDNRVYLFDVQWNASDRDGLGSWFVDVREADRTLIAASLKIVLGAFIGRRVNHQLFRNGVLVAADTTNLGRDAGFDDLGSRVVVRWIPMVRVLSILRSRK